MDIPHLLERIHHELLPGLHLESHDPHDPVIVRQIPEPWRLLGTGNYAAVFYHPSNPDYVVKIYAPDRPGFREEVEVYHRLGSHPAFSQCFHAQNGFLVLKRLYGITLYDSIHRGLFIPPQVIHDIDEALNYARSRDLNPHDVHGRNVMMCEGRGLVVDVSDFLHADPCSAWDDLKRAYYGIYLPLRPLFHLRIPYGLLNLVRKLYRLYRRCRKALRRSSHAQVSSRDSAKRYSEKFPER